MKLKQLLHRLHTDEQGMTLVEIMVSFALLTLVLMLSLSMMSFGGRVLVKGSDKDRLKMVGDEMYDRLTQSLTFATHIQLLPQGSDPAEAAYENILYVQGGRLYQGTRASGVYQPVYPDHLYQNTVLQMETAVPGEAVLSLTLRFLEQNQPLYIGSSALNLLNLSAGTDAVTIEGTPGMNNVISYDGEPYSILEGYQPVPNDIEYTVERYWIEHPEYIQEFVPGQVYQKGDIMCTKDGKYWQLLYRGYSYQSGPQFQPGSTSYPPGFSTPPWKSLEREWGGAYGKKPFGAYDRYDVVSLKDAFYCSAISYNMDPIHKEYGEIHENWIPVYWFPEKSTQRYRAGGWSSKQDTYVGIRDPNFGK